MLKKKEPEEVYFYASQHAPQHFSFYVFDDQYYYHSKDVYLSKHLKTDMENNNVELNKILEKKSQEIHLNKEYYLLAYWDILVASHNYTYTITYLNEYNLWGKKNINFLFLKTDNHFYNTFIDFLKNQIFLDCNFEQIESNKLYKIKKLNLIKMLHSHPPHAPGAIAPHHLAYEKYSDILRNKLEDKNKPKNKIFNIKFNTNSQLCHTQNRVFNANQNIFNVLKKHGYEELNTNTELEKQIMLQNSSHIICSWGGNSHINVEISSFNSNRKCLILCHELYEVEWKPLFAMQGCNSELQDINMVDVNIGNNRARLIRNIDFDKFDEIISNFEKDLN